MGTDPRSWSIQDTAVWLETILRSYNHDPSSIEKTMNLFTKHMINGHALLLLSQEDFREMCLPLGMRGILLLEIDQLKRGVDQRPAMVSLGRSKAVHSSYTTPNTFQFDGRASNARGLSEEVHSYGSDTISLASLSMSTTSWDPVGSLGLSDARFGEARNPGLPRGANLYGSELRHTFPGQRRLAPPGLGPLGLSPDLSASDLPSALPEGLLEGSLKSAAQSTGVRPSVCEPPAGARMWQPGAGDTRSTPAPAQGLGWADDATSRSDLSRTPSASDSVTAIQACNQGAELPFASAGQTAQLSPGIQNLMESTQRTAQCRCAGESPSFGARARVVFTHPSNYLVFLSEIEFEDPEGAEKLQCKPDTLACFCGPLGQRLVPGDVHKVAVCSGRCDKWDEESKCCKELVASEIGMDPVESGAQENQPESRISGYIFCSAPGKRYWIRNFRNDIAFCYDSQDIFSGRPANGTLVRYRQSAGMEGDAVASDVRISKRLFGHLCLGIVIAKKEHFCYIRFLRFLSPALQIDDDQRDLRPRVVVCNCDRNTTFINDCGVAVVFRLRTIFARTDANWLAFDVCPADQYLQRHISGTVVIKFEGKPYGKIKPDDRSDLAWYHEARLDPHVPLPQRNDRVLFVPFFHSGDFGSNLARQRRAKEIVVLSSLSQAPGVITTVKREEGRMSGTVAVETGKSHAVICFDELTWFVEGEQASMSLVETDNRHVAVGDDVVVEKVEKFFDETTGMALRAMKILKL